MYLYGELLIRLYRLGWFLRRASIKAIDRLWIYSYNNLYRKALSDWFPIIGCASKNNKYMQILLYINLYSGLL